MAKRYICNGCDTLYDKKYKCDKVCSLCAATQPWAKDQSKYCGTCNRWFLSEKCFQNYLILKVKGKLFCQWRQVCRNCSYLLTSYSKHECFKKFCTFCNKKQPSGHLCYVAPLKPSKLSNKYFTFSLIRSAHKTLKAWWVFWVCSEPHVLSKCVVNVKPSKMLMSIVNGLESVSTRSGKTP